MTSQEQIPGGDDDLVDRSEQNRSWVHPSQAGLNRRSCDDRRRSQLLAAGIVLTGAALLLGRSH